MTTNGKVIVVDSDTERASQCGTVLNFLDYEASVYNDTSKIAWPHQPPNRLDRLNARGC